MGLIRATGNRQQATGDRMKGRRGVLEIRNFILSYNK